MYQEKGLALFIAVKGTGCITWCMCVCVCIYIYILLLHVSAYPGHSHGIRLFIIEGTKALKLLSA